MGDPLGSGPFGPFRPVHSVYVWSWDPRGVSDGDGLVAERFPTAQ